MALLALWLGLRQTSERKAQNEPRTVVAATHEASAPIAPTTASAPPFAFPPAPPVASPAPSLNVVGSGPDDPHEPGMVPHPLDEAHARIDTENRLLQALNDAMSFRKAKDMRDLLVTYRQLDPLDTDKNQLGYKLIADCIEFPGEASLAAAHAFYDTERHSPLRRFVRRICFENAN